VFDEKLRQEGLIGQKGKIVDASFVEAPRQRNTKEENETIKKGEIPEGWKENKHKMRQKDVDARWTKKGVENQVCEIAYRNNPLSETQKTSNQSKSRVRVRVEHVFGFMTNSMKSLRVRSIGIVRARWHIGMMNLVACNTKKATPSSPNAYCKKLLCSAPDLKVLRERCAHRHTFVLCLDGAFS